MRPPFDVACLSSVWIAEELLGAEGFEDVQYLPLNETRTRHRPARRRRDRQHPARHLLDPAGDRPAQAGYRAWRHPCRLSSCSGKQEQRGISDPKGKTIAVADHGRHAFVAAMLVRVGLEPRRGVKFVETGDGVRLRAEGKVDATHCLAPEPQIMRVQKIGTSIEIPRPTAHGQSVFVHRGRQPHRGCTTRA